MRFNSWAGTNKHPSQENVESSQQALNPEIHPRTELTTSNSQDLDPDRKPTTEALGDAGLSLYTVFSCLVPSILFKTW